MPASFHYFPAQMFNTCTYCQAPTFHIYFAVVPKIYVIWATVLGSNAGVIAYSVYFPPDMVWSSIETLLKKKPGNMSVILLHIELSFVQLHSILIIVVTHDYYGPCLCIGSFHCMLSVFWLF